MLFTLPGVMLLFSVPVVSVGISIAGFLTNIFTDAVHAVLPPWNLSLSICIYSHIPGHVSKSWVRTSIYALSIN